MPQIVRGFAIAATFMVASSCLAQERPNPFVPPSSAAEEQARVEERLRAIVWELHPEMKTMIMRDVTAAQASLEIKMKRHVDAVVSTELEKIKENIAENGTKNSAGGADGSAGSVSETNLPEGAKFFSCVNGKALYSDSNNNLFQVQDSSDKGNLLCAD